MSTPTQIAGRPYFTFIYGPFHLASLTPITAQDLDNDDGALWSQIGVVLDPSDYRHDYHAIRRVLSALAAWECFTTGQEWIVTPESLAARIHLYDHPIVVFSNPDGLSDF